jgi:putative spermidine/putrescine transport system permease protein
VGYAAGYSLGLLDLVHPGLTFRHWARTLAEGEVLASLGYSLYVAAVTMLLTVGVSLGLVLGLGPPGAPGVVYGGNVSPAGHSGAGGGVLLPATAVAVGAAGAGGLPAGLGGLDRRFSRTGAGAVRHRPGAAHAFLATPFFTLLFRNLYLHERGDELGQAARTLGASAWQSLRRVVVPLLLRRAAAPLLLYFIFVLGSYEIPLLLGTQSPRWCRC